MTSDEIKRMRATDWSDTCWLREIAIQLALLNEKPTPVREIPQPQFKKAR